MGGECGTDWENRRARGGFDGGKRRGRASLKNLTVDEDIKMDHKQQDGSGVNCSP